MRTSILVIVSAFIWLFCPLGIFAQEMYIPDREFRGQTIWDLPSLPESRVDIGLWALIVAKEAQPEIDIPRYLKQLDGLGQTVLNGLPNTKEDMAKLMLTQIVLYQPGHWNAGQVFSYDLDDPLGENWESKLLNTYLDTRKGNCVSMPTLYWAVMERVDSQVPIFGVEAPFHLFIRMRDRQQKKWVNMETTNGHTAREEWIRAQCQVPQDQIDAGIYLKNLSKKQFLAVLIGSLEHWAVREKRLDQAWKYNSLRLALDPKSARVIANRGALLHMGVKEVLDLVKSEYREPTPFEFERMKRASENGVKYLNQARSMGWEPLIDSHRDEYLERIKKERESLQIDK